MTLTQAMKTQTQPTPQAQQVLELPPGKEDEIGTIIKFEGILTGNLANNKIYARPIPNGSFSSGDTSWAIGLWLDQGLNRVIVNLGSGYIGTSEWTGKVENTTIYITIYYTKKPSQL